MDANDTVSIHGSPWKMADLAPLIQRCRSRTWRQQRWVKRDALVERGSGLTLPYQGQPYNPVEFELVRGGWKRNTCEICWWDLMESDKPEHAVGYTDGRQWLCSECHDRFIKKY